MVEFEKTRFYKVLQVYKMYYLIYLLLAFNAFFNASKVMNYLTYVTAFFGGALLLWMIVQYKYYKKVRNLWILVAFVASYAFSAMMNLRYGIVENIEGLVWLVVPIGILYVTTTRYSVALMKKEFCILSIIYIVYCTCTNLFSLSMLYWGRMYDFIDQTGTARPIGFRWGRLWGAYDDPNHGATIALIAIIFALYLLQLCKKKWYKIGLIGTILVQYLYMVFSDSRTGYVGMILGILVWLFFTESEKGSNLGRKRIIRVLVKWILFSAIVIGGIYGCKEAYNSKPVQTFITTQRAKVDAVIQKPVQTKRKDDLKGNESNGRTDIWLSGVEIVQTTPVYGTGFRNITSYAMDKTPHTYIVNNKQLKYDSMHNVVLDVLVGQGVIGIVICLVLLWSTIKCLRKQHKEWLTKDERFVGVIMTSILTIGITSLFVSVIFYVNCPQNYWLWLCMGYLMNLVQKSIKKME